MMFATRHFKFTSTITGSLNTQATLSAEYDVVFRRCDTDNWTNVAITPDFGPQKEIRIRDIDITWRSLFYAYKWCHRHASLHLLDWTETDLIYDDAPGCTFVTGMPVIPVDKLSTSPLTANHV